MVHARRCRKRKETYSKVGNVFAVLVVCVAATAARAHARDSSARGQSLLCSRSIYSH